MSQHQKRPRGDPTNKYCDSCGDFGCYRFHNHGYLCWQCYNMDKRGFARSKDGTIISSENELKILNSLFDKSRGYK